MNIWIYLGYAIIAVAIIIGIWFVINFPIASGQEVVEEILPAVPPTAPTVTNVPTPTTPNPNFQYLPQKAYVQPFAPEVGIPDNAIPLTAVPQVVPVQPQPTQNQTTSAPGGFDVGSIISMAVAAGSGLLAKVGLDKAKKSEDLTKETMSGALQSKEAIEEIAKKLFETMGTEKANAIQDAPAIKLETLAKDKEEFADKAAKA